MDHAIRAPEPGPVIDVRERRLNTVTTGRPVQGARGGALDSEQPAPGRVTCAAAAARVVNHALDGWHSFGADRDFVALAEAACPDFIAELRAQRAFGERVVRWCAAQGIDQFLDIGPGLPYQGATHEILAHLEPPPDRAPRVVYVDTDLVAVYLAQDLQAGHPYLSAIHADLRDPLGILIHPDLPDWFDLARPTAVLLCGVLAHIPDRDAPAAVLRELTNQLAPGSLLALSHPVHRTGRLGEQSTLRALYDRTSTPMHHRSHAELRGWLSHVDILPPGLVAVHTWRPELAQNWPVGMSSATVGAVAQMS